jgi:predicted nucleic acid-binding protein
MMIAATAIVADLTLVTHNTSEFSRVADLKLMDWGISA